MSEIISKLLKMQYPKPPHHHYVSTHTVTATREPRCQESLWQIHTTAKPAEDEAEDEAEALSQPRYPNQRAAEGGQIKEVMNRLGNTGKLLKV